jgi:hypothetical protein
MMDLHRRFYLAMGTYAVLAILSGVTLDGKMRLAVWVFLAGLAARTMISYKRLSGDE